MASLKAMSIAELEQRRRAQVAFGVDTGAVDQELRSRPKPPSGEAELKMLAMPALQQRRKLAVKRDFKAALGAIDAELSRRGVQPERRQRKVYMPGPTCGSTTIIYVDED